MPHWLDFRNNCRNKYLWTDEEIGLLLQGEYVLGRTLSACKKKRLSLGIRFRSRPDRSIPYNPPKRANGEIPFPKWWKSAHRMRAEGYWVSEISTILNKDKTAVRIALYPEVHAAHLRSKREKWAITPKTAEIRERDRIRNAAVDPQRKRARLAAREEWRASGGDPRALEGFYRRFDCL